MQFTYTLADGGFINLNSLDTSFLQIHHFITKGEGELLGLKLTRNVGTWEGPVEDGYWAGQHSLHRFLRDALGIAAPLDGNRVGTTDIVDDDGRANISRAVALNPTVLGENKAIELLAKVLDHVVPFRFTVDKKIETDFLLDSNNVLDLLLDERLVLLFSDLALVQLGTSITDLLSLGEGSNGGGGELGQV